jgi:hypothetical protein
MSKSDHPHDLTERREQFLRSFVRRGVELTEELLGENRTLQTKLMELEEENTRMRAHLASDDAIRELLQKIEGLERERSLLLSRSTQLESVTRQAEGRYREIEHDLTELASLNVAGDQLASHLEPRRVVRNIRELLEQLVGVRSFVLYRVEPSGTHAVPLALHGPAAEGAPSLPLNEGGSIADACLTGVLWVADRIDPNAPPQPSGLRPIAIVPLVAGDQTVAVIVVLELLPHKVRWEAVDRELFKLLSRRAPVSLIAAGLHRSDMSPRAALGSFDEALQVSSREGRG